MATKIRLQRFGKKGKPFYHVVIADSRSPRDGKFIERLGSYNPNTNPATIELDFDKTFDWVNKGAEPTDTVRAILSYKGILYRKHLEGGIKKGALTEEQAAEKFTAWLDAKSGKISGKTEGLATSKADARKNALAAEAKKNEDRAAALAAKNAPPAEEVPEVVAEETPVEETVAESAPTEETAAPATEAVVDAPVAETPAAEVTETPEEKTEDKA